MAAPCWGDHLLVDCPPRMENNEMMFDCDYEISLHEDMTHGVATDINV